MPASIRAPSRRILLEPLNPDNFAPFGSVIENPSHSRSKLKTTLQSIPANQGSARKWVDVTTATNFYSLAPSRQPGRLTVSLFMCSPRQLHAPVTSLDEEAIRAVPNTQPTWAQPPATAQPAPGIFNVSILERHPYTSQTFIPLGLGKADKSTHYLVIVAPTLPSPRRTRPKPYQSPEPDAETANPSLSREPAGPGAPDLSAIRAFLANGSQAVTYGAGTWHAPMVVVGRETVDFVVVQHVSGVPDEDCQEVLLERAKGGEGLTVLVDLDGRSKASFLRARL